MPVSKKDGSTTYVFIYVDDLLVAGISGTSDRKRKQRIKPSFWY